jgi:hypothetical protein
MTQIDIGNLVVRITWIKIVRRLDDDWLRDALGGDNPCLCELCE